jgi:hypothetical protein
MTKRRTRVLTERGAEQEKHDIEALAAYRAMLAGPDMVPDGKVIVERYEDGHVIRLRMTPRESGLREDPHSPVFAMVSDCQGHECPR